MIRRNLILAILAVPAAVGSAAMLSAIDSPNELALTSKVAVHSCGGESDAPAVIESQNEASEFENAQSSINELAVFSERPAALVRDQSLADLIDTAPDNVDPSGTGWAAEAIDMPATVAAEIVQHNDRPMSMSPGRVGISTGSRTSHPPLMQAGGGAAHIVRASGTKELQSSAVAPRMAAMSLNGDYCWWFEPPPLSIAFGDAVSGQPVPLALQIINDEAQTEVFACQVSVYAIGDDGESLGEVGPATDILVSVDGESTALHDLLPLQPDQLLPWLSQTQTFNVVVTGIGQSSGDQFASDNYLYVPVPSIIVTLTPDTDVQAGDMVRVTVESYEPLGIALSSVKLRFNGGTQLMQSGQTAAEDGTVSDVIVLLGDLPAQSGFVREEWFVAVDPTWAFMTVQLEAQEIVPQYNCAWLWDDSDWIDPGDGEDIDEVPITVFMTPDTDVQAGDLVKVTIQSDGPLPIALTDVTLRLNGGTQLLQAGQTVSEDGTVSDVIISLGDLPAQSDLLHEEWFIAEDPTWAGMSVQLEAQEIDPQYGWAELWDSTIWIDAANTMDVRLGLPHFEP